MKKKCSMMGSSKYEYNPKQFDIDISRKQNFIENTVKEIEALIINKSIEYKENTNGSKDLFKDDVMRRLVKNHLGK